MAINFITSKAEKIKIIKNLLEERESIYAVVLTECQGVKVPSNFYENATVTLELSLRFRGSLFFLEDGIKAELIFDVEYEECFIPWDSIITVYPSSGDANQYIFTPETLIDDREGHSPLEIITKNSAIKEDNEKQEDKKKSTKRKSKEEIQEPNKDKNQNKNQNDDKEKTLKASKANAKSNIKSNSKLATKSPAKSSSKSKITTLKICDKKEEKASSSTKKSSKKTSSTKEATKDKLKDETSKNDTKNKSKVTMVDFTLIK